MDRGDIRYRQVPGWDAGAGVAGQNCHGIVCTRDGNVILLTDHTKNNFIVLSSPAGKVIHKWGTAWPGAHGLSIVTEGDRESDPPISHATASLRARSAVNCLANGAGRNKREAIPKKMKTSPPGRFMRLTGFLRARRLWAGLYHSLWSGWEVCRRMAVPGAGLSIGGRMGMLDDRNPANPGPAHCDERSAAFAANGFCGETRADPPARGQPPANSQGWPGNYFIAHLGDRVKISNT